MNDNIISFNQLVTDLVNMNENFKDEHLILMLLKSLFKEFEFFETTLLHGKANVSLSVMCVTLYGYELRKMEKHRNSTRDVKVLVVQVRPHIRSKVQKGDPSQKENQVK
ncbi:hypothetical protein J1N35_037047, partial [Gossypium stocksii]